MLSPELIKKIKHIQIRAGHLATDAMAGEYQSAFKGKGMEFDEVREYMPGDDVRTIDWNVTARMGQPFIKVFKEEREMTMILMVDVSPSQGFGSSGRDKNEIAAEFAAVLAFLAVKNNDKVGLLLFSDHVELFIPPGKGRGHVWNLIKEVLSHKGSGKSTDIESALQRLMLVTKRKALCFLISDFQAKGYEKLMKQVARRHDLVCVEVLDQVEKELPDVGMIDVVDSETGETLTLDTGSALFRNGVLDLATARSLTLKEACRRQGIDHFPLSTCGDLVNVLTRFLKERERRRFR